MNRWDFTIDYLAVGAGNSTHQNKPALVDAYVQVGPMRLRAYLNPLGDLSISDTLHDDALRVEIAVAMRKAAALAKLVEQFERMDASDRKRLAERQRQTAKSAKPDPTPMIPTDKENHHAR